MKKILFTIITLALLVPDIGLAQEAQNVSISPAHVDIKLDRGSYTTVGIAIRNDLGRTAGFKVSVEDVQVVSESGNAQPVSGERANMYIEPSASSFVIPSGETRQLPVTVTIPREMNTRSLYGAVVITIDPASSQTSTGAAVETRLASLFFVRIGGEAHEEATLTTFSTADNGKFYSSWGKESDLAFKIGVNNSGDVHVNPYGGITIRNIFGQVKEIIPIDPWYVLPETERSLVVSSRENYRFGFYTATLELNKGYQDQVVTESLSFIGFPFSPWYVLGALLILFLVWILSRVRVIRKPLYTTAVILLVLFSTETVLGYVASSTNYRLERDSINTGGELSTSTNYSLEDTAGEVATGLSTSTNYRLKAGYQQLDVVILTITSPSDVTLLPTMSTGGGTSDGSTEWTVTTNNSAGYTLTIKASTNPALQSSTANFANYTTAGTPEFTWSVAATAKEFGFTPEGSHIVNTYKDNGTNTCNTGTSDTASACWDALTTSDKEIARGTAANNPTGTATTVRFRAEAGATSGVAAGNYQAVVTATATAL